MQLFLDINLIVVVLKYKLYLHSLKHTALVVLKIVEGQLGNLQVFFRVMVNIFIYEFLPKFRLFS